MPLFLVFFFSTNSTNSIAHYNKESRFLALKNGTNSSLACVEGHQSNDAPWGLLIKLQVKTLVVSVFVLKRTFALTPADL